MEEQILRFPEQLQWVPKIENSDKLQQANKFIICGMGGSHLAAGLLRAAEPTLDLLIHRDYDLPRVPDYFLRESLIIASSHSGNTAETLAAAQAAVAAGLAVAVVATGGQLLAFAQDQGLPFVQYPASGLEPRLALGYQLRALAALLGNEARSEALAASTLDPAALAEPGRHLALELAGKIPLVYASTINYPLAYVWKIKFNETAKVPAFANVFPELNHNELQSYDGGGASFAAVFLEDQLDDPRLLKRMATTKTLYEARGLKVLSVSLSGAGLGKLLASSLLADWTTLRLAESLGHNPRAVPTIEEFKKLIA